MKINCSVCCKQIETSKDCKNHYAHLLSHGFIEIMANDEHGEVIWVWVCSKECEDKWYEED